MQPFSWTCPYCGRPTTITSQDVREGDAVLNIDNSDGYRMSTSTYIVCPNPECKKFAFRVKLSSAVFAKGLGWREGETLKTWQLLPQSKAQSFPEYIPRAIIDDYNEACLIKELSPKASATLSRRCLQGIIRDFWSGKVKPGKLGNEINQIKEEVDELTWKAIDATRSVGNIGAHMEEDVNLIIDIEPNEAELLIELIETLLKAWYVAREEKRMRLEALVQLGADKEAARKPKQDKSTQSSGGAQPTIDE